MDNATIEHGLTALGLTNPQQRLGLRLFLAQRTLPTAGQWQASKADWRYELTQLGLTHVQTDRLLVALREQPATAAPVPTRQYDPYKMSPDPSSPESMAYFYPAHQAHSLFRK